MSAPLHWIKRHYAKIVVAVLIIAGAVAFSRTALCPVCGGILRAPRAVAAKADVQPSKNLAIWNGSYHGPPYEDYSRVCTRCWMAYHDYWKRWERASDVPDSFYRPLRPAIRNVPLPPPERIHFLVVYTQSIDRRRVAEMVHFWCDNSPAVIAPLESYAASHSLVWRTSLSYSEPEQICVHLQTHKDI